MNLKTFSHFQDQDIPATDTSFCFHSPTTPNTANFRLPTTPTQLTAYQLAWRDRRNRTINLVSTVQRRILNPAAQLAWRDTQNEPHSNFSSR